MLVTRPLSGLSHDGLLVVHSPTCLSHRRLLVVNPLNCLSRSGLPVAHHLTSRNGLPVAHPQSCLSMACLVCPDSGPHGSHIGLVLTYSLSCIYLLMLHLIL